jgi:nitrite reductase (NADH) large subunit
MIWREDESTVSSSLQAPFHSHQPSQSVSEDAYADIVIIGAGRAGFHMAQLLKGFGRILVFDAEPFAPYDRVKLSNLLSREVEEGHLFFDLSCFADDRNLKFVRRRIVKIDAQARFVRSENRRRTYYGKLVLCLGSASRRPSIPGIDLKGVYTFRDLGDGRQLIEHADRAAHAVIIGGGYLGLETASGLHRRGLQCGVVETQPQLMPGQLEAAAAAHLKAMFEELGMAAHTGRQVEAIEGNAAREATAVRLDGGETLKAEMIVVCAGVAPNVGLARDAGLRTGRGIIVDDAMRTSDPNIYAVGECAEHRGRLYGLVGPAIEQAEIAVDALRGGEPAYGGSVAASSLKIAGIDLFVAGDFRVGDDKRTRIVAYRDRKSGAYRALAVRDKRIVGGVAIGQWAHTYRLRRAVEISEPIENGQARRFARTGHIWVEHATASVANWPCEALLCNCRLVTKGTIDVVIASGARTQDAVSRATGAAQLCGSCKPLIDELLGQGSDTKPPFLGALGVLSLVVLASLAAFLAVPIWPVPLEISSAFRVDALWTNSVLKQVTGFSLLASVLIGGLLFLRKRTSYSLPGSYKAWRLVHAGLGGLMIGLLFAHTGFSLGSHLNGWLMTSFLTTLSAGVLAGLAASVDARLAFPGGNAKLRRAAAWLHILIAWPLPLLLFVHILMVYYF